MIYIAYSSEKITTMSQLPAIQDRVVKSNQLIEARFKFTLWETRVFTRMVNLLKKEDKEFQRHRLYIKDLMDFYGSSSKEDYKVLKRIPISLSKKQIHIKGKDKDGKSIWYHITLFPTTISPGDDDSDDNDSSYNSYIELRFNEDLKPLLLELKEMYKIYDINCIIPLRSVYSIRIFELLKQYEKIGERTMTMLELKEMLHLIETEEEFKDRVDKLRGEEKEKAKKKGRKEQYKKYTDFRKRVLEQAKKELTEHCDIEFSYEEIRERRNVKAIKFTITKNPRFQRFDETSSIDIADSLSSKLQETFNKFSFSQEKAFRLLLDFKMRADTITNVLIPSMTGGEIDGFEDLFVELILAHFKTSAKNPVPDVLFDWWVKKGVYTEGQTWSKLNEKLSGVKKKMEKSEPNAFFNRLEAKNMTASQFKKWYARQQQTIN